MEEKKLNYVLSHSCVRKEPPELIKNSSYSPNWIAEKHLCINYGDNELLLALAKLGGVHEAESSSSSSSFSVPPLLWLWFWPGGLVHILTLKQRKEALQFSLLRATPIGKSFFLLLLFRGRTHLWLLRIHPHQVLFSSPPSSHSRSLAKTSCVCEREKDGEKRRKVGGRRRRRKSCHFQHPHFFFFSLFHTHTPKKKLLLLTKGGDDVQPTRKEGCGFFFSGEIMGITSWGRRQKLVSLEKVLVVSPTPFKLDGTQHRLATLLLRHH